MSDWKVGQRVDVIRNASKPLARAKSPLERRRWGLVNVQRYREDDVEERIKALGYVTYVPRLRVSVRDKTKHRAWKEQRKPTFAGYGFVCFSPDHDPWGDIERVRGVVAIVKAGELPVPAPDRLIDQLRTAESGNFEQPYRTDGAAQYQPMDRLLVTDGPFKWNVVEFVASLAGLDDDGRIVALLDAFGRKTPIELQASQVERE